MPMFESLHVIISLWPHMVVGTVLLLIGVGVGLCIGRARSFVMVRWVHAWVSSVIIPLLYKRSWLIRTITIFANNMAILVGIILLGNWSSAAIIGIALVGLSMGIALRVLSDLPESFAAPNDQTCESKRRLFRLGMLLNLLEPPAIIVALGISMGRTVASLSDVEIWEVLCWVFPAMLLAACGEALWIGIAIQTNTEASSSNSV